jgi:hypothetical protein
VLFAVFYSGYADTNQQPDRSPFESSYFPPPMNKEQALALKDTLGSICWWSTNPHNFPELISAPVLSNRRLLLEMLTDDLKSKSPFSEQSLGDQFHHLVVAIAAAVPIINQPPNEDADPQSQQLADDLTNIFAAYASDWTGLRRSCVWILAATLTLTFWHRNRKTNHFSYQAFHTHGTKTPLSGPEAHGKHFSPDKSALRDTSAAKPLPKPLNTAQKTSPRKNK